MILDQLDIVSAFSGRNIDYFEAVKEIIKEAKYSAERLIHVVLVCRKFDWNNDHRLGGLLSKNDKTFCLKDFSIEEVKEVLNQRNITPSRLSNKQLTLLRRPQHLSLFMLIDWSTDEFRFNHVQNLFSAYWEQKRKAIKSTLPTEEDCWTKIIDFLVDKMTASQQLSVSKSFLDDFVPDYVKQMVSEGVLSLSESRYSFGHESFFDYCFARRFQKNGKTLTKFLLENEQPLFRRSQVRQVLIYLRAEDFSVYLSELDSLLNDERIRPHIRDLSISVLSAVETPKDREFALVAKHLDNYELFHKSDLKTALPLLVTSDFGAFDMV